MLMKGHEVGRSAVGSRVVTILALLVFFGGCGSGASIDLTNERTAAHAVDLSWKASTSPTVSGYNIYRSTSPDGPFTKINSTPVLETKYTDTTVVAGTTYYYAATSIDSDGRESAYSALTRVDVP
jgi:fibronectin type 3 domain-containing protein